MKSQKAVFKSIFALFALLLLILPFMVSFNETLTKAVEAIKIYTLIQSFIVPYEVGMVKVLTSPFNVDFVAYANGMMVRGGFLEMTWNCIGWQSLLLLTITLVVGLTSGKYTLLSNIEAILIGIFGTFLINLLRLSVIVLIFVYFRPIYFYVYHDYLAAVVTVIWLTFFWWFIFKFVLEPRKGLVG